MKKCALFIFLLLFISNLFAQNVESFLNNSSSFSKAHLLSMLDDLGSYAAQWEGDRNNDLEWRALYYAQNNFYHIVKVNIIGELNRKFPDAAELKILMLERWESSYYINGLNIEPEILSYSDKFPKEKQIIKEGYYWLAFNTVRSNYRKEKEVIAAVDAFFEKYSGDDLGLRLLEIGANYLPDLPGKITLSQRIIDLYPDSDQAVRAKAATLVGREFTVSFTDELTGNQISVRDLRGKVVVIDFWATWCGPCVSEIPNMIEIYNKYKPQGLEIIGISLDSASATLVNYCKENGITWPQYCEEGKTWNTELSKEWGITAIPTVFILDKSGKIASTEARGRLETLIPQLLNK